MVSLILWHRAQCDIVLFVICFVFMAGLLPLLSSRFSVSNDLKYDAERDLRDIGAKNILVHSLNKVWKYFTMYN